MAFRVVSAALAAIVLGHSNTVAAQQIQADQFSARWGSWIGMGGELGGGRTVGDVNLFMPVWQNETTLGFVDLRSAFDHSSALQGSFGGGFRHMLTNGWNLGVHGYYERQRSNLGLYYNQASVGFEALGPWIDFRVNGYLPVGGSRGEAYSSQLASSTTTGVVVQNGSSLSIQSTQTNIYDQIKTVERSMTGVDAEFGVKLPVFPDELKLDLKAFAGAYHFSAPGVADITGPRLRLELTSKDFAGRSGARLTGGVAWQDDVRGDQWSASARLNIPLSGQAKDGRQLTEQEERMLDPIKRSVEIVTNSRSQTIGQTTNVTTRTEDAINSWNNKRIASVNNIDASVGSTAVQSYLDSQQLAAGNDGSVVVLNGALAAAQGLTLNDNQTLLGGGTSLKIHGSVTGVELDYAATGTSGSVSGSGYYDPDNNYNGLVHLGNNSVVGGLTITQNSTARANAAIFASETSGSVAFGNDIYGSTGNYSHGIVFHKSVDGIAYGNTITIGNFTGTTGLVAANSSKNILFEGNDITAQHSGSNAISVYISSSAKVVDNIIRPVTGNTVFDVDVRSTVLSGSEGNTVIGPYLTLCAISADSSGEISFTNAPNCTF